MTESRDLLEKQWNKKESGPSYMATYLSIMLQKTLTKKKVSDEEETLFRTTYNQLDSLVSFVDVNLLNPLKWSIFEISETYTRFLDEIYQYNDVFEKMKKYVEDKDGLLKVKGKDVLEECEHIFKKLTFLRKLISHRSSISFSNKDLSTLFEYKEKPEICVYEGLNPDYTLSPIHPFFHKVEKINNENEFTRFENEKRKFPNISVERNDVGNNMMTFSNKSICELDTKIVLRFNASKNKSYALIAFNEIQTIIASFYAIGSSSQLLAGCLIEIFGYSKTDKIADL